MPNTTLCFHSNKKYMTNVKVITEDGIKDSKNHHCYIYVTSGIITNTFVSLLDIFPRNNAKQTWTYVGAPNVVKRWTNTGKRRCSGIWGYASTKTRITLVTWDSPFGLFLYPLGKNELNITIQWTSLHPGKGSDTYVR